MLKRHLTPNVPSVASGRTSHWLAREWHIWDGLASAPIHHTRTSKLRMHKSVAKASVNTALSKNYFQLSLEERDYVIAHAKIGRFYISPRSIMASVQSATNQEGKKSSPLRLFKFNLINYDPLESRSFANDRTFRFISEIICDKKSYRDTELFQHVGLGNRISRTVDGEPHRQRIVISTEEDFLKYYDSCMALIDSITKHGFLDVEYGEGEMARQIRSSHKWNQGTTIGIAIDGGGNLLHFTKGHHRVAIAYHLNVDKIPIAVNYISGSYFRRFVSPLDLLSERRFIPAVSRAVDCALGPHLAR